MLSGISSALFTFLSKYKKLNFRIVCSYCYVTPKRYAPVAAQRELLLTSCTTEHHVHLGGGGGYMPQRVGFTLFGLSSGRRAVLTYFVLTYYVPVSEFCASLLRTEKC